MIIYLFIYLYLITYRRHARAVPVKTEAFAFQITKRINIIVPARRDTRIIIARQVIKTSAIFVGLSCPLCFLF